MLLSNYSQSVAGMFALLNVVVTAGNLPFYFVCSLLVLLGAHRFAGLSPRRARFVKAAALGAILYCLWATIGIGAKPLKWALGLLGLGVLVYVAGRFLATPAPVAESEAR
jgi:hypothetical protein